MRRTTVRPARLILPVLLVLCCSCCQGGKRCYPVRGHVFVNGKPAPGVMLVLHLVGDPDPHPIQPSGVVQADGSFELRSFLINERVVKEGAPAGTYRVACTWYPEDLEKYLGREILPDKLNGRYADPESSGLRAEVQEKPNELPPFQLEVRK